METEGEEKEEWVAVAEGREKGEEVEMTMM